MMRSMSIAREYTRALRRHLRCHAVWPPTLAVVPGDYGVFVRGVWNRIGNVTTDFGVEYVTEPGGHQAEKFQYQSTRTSTGGVQASVAYLGAEAELAVSLSERASFFVSLSEFDVDRLQSPRNVAVRLRAHPQWTCLRYYVAWELYRGHDLLFFGSESGGAGVTIRGDTEELKALQTVGKLGASLEFSTVGEVSMQIKGSERALAGFGVNLFRVRAVGAEPLALTFAAGPTDDEPIEYADADGDPDEDEAQA